jgi:hypothetical protein
MVSTATPSRISHLIAAQLGRNLLQQFLPPAADDQLGAEFGKAVAHRSTKAGTAAGNEDALLRQQALFKHSLIPPHCIVAQLQIRHEAENLLCV